MSDSHQVTKNLTRITTLSDNEEAALRPSADARRLSVSQVGRKVTADRLAAALTPTAAQQIAADAEALDAARDELEARQEVLESIANGFRVLVAKRTTLLERIKHGQEQIAIFQQSISIGPNLIFDNIGIPREACAVFAPHVAMECAKSIIALPLMLGALESLIEATEKNAQDVKDYAAANNINRQFIPADLL